MLGSWQFRMLTLLGAIALALVMANGILFEQNREVQGQINQRQQFVQQTVPLEGLYREIAKALAELGIKNNDKQLLQMLAARGINVAVNPPPAATAAVPAAATAPVKR
ncbi:MAG: hypothetical protein Q8L49_04725 [Burkholderiaceae bacterium]|nr:hypothetical protein [Burkholderiaceae bacterium]